MRNRYLLLIFGVLLFGLVVVGSAVAQQPAPTPSDDQVNAIAKQLYCPVCENTPLDVCPTTACAQWRELIRQKLAAGWSDQAIKDYFVQQYGARVLGKPPCNGINCLAYVVPPVAILAGGYILFRAYRAWKRPVRPVESSPTVQGPPPAQDDYVQRMEDEIRKG